MSFYTSLSLFLLGHRPKLIFDWHTQFLVICTFVICECPPSIYLECKKRFFSDPSLICAITCNLNLVSDLTETTQFSSETLACLMQLMKALPPHERFAKRPPACHRLLSMNFTIFDHKKYSFYF